MPNYSSVRSAWSNGSAHVAGKVEPRMELIFPFRNNFNCPKLVWKLLILGKKETAAKQGLCCTSIRSYRELWVYVQLLPSLLLVTAL